MLGFEDVSRGLRVMAAPGGGLLPSSLKSPQFAPRFAGDTNSFAHSLGHVVGGSRTTYSSRRRGVALPPPKPSSRRLVMDYNPIANALLLFA